MTKRDYSLLGPDGQRAVDTGLAAAEWYHTDVPRKVMKELMQRSDAPAIRDTIIYYGLMLVTVGIGIALWPHWYSAPFWLAYGVLYGSASDSRWHECQHGTAFKTPWMNNVVYEIASFMVMRNSVTWRWSHARHHTNTYIVGMDPEIAVMRPADVPRVAFGFIGIEGAWGYLKGMITNAFSGVTAEEKTFIPQSEWPKVVRVARISTAIYAATLLLALYMHSILPLMVIGLPRLYGCWHMSLVGLLQHAGLADNVVDHRLNSRTVYMNPVSRFLYWNMNYHVEHHMFPMVPYHALPRLHEIIKHDLPAPNTSMWQAYTTEVFPAWKRQLKYEDYFVQRDLPPTAKPYRMDFHEGALGQVTRAAE
jgi:fatty acid desaturase